MMLGADPFGPRTHHHPEGQPPSRSLQPRPITASRNRHSVTTLDSEGSPATLFARFEQSGGEAMRLTGFLLASVMTVAAVSGAQAQQQGQPSAEASPPQGEGLTKLLDFKSSGGTLDFETVPQTGEAAQSIKENLKR